LYDSLRNKRSLSLRGEEQVGEDKKVYLLKLALRISDMLKNDPRVEAIWVCGSVGRGEADEFSDLDIMVSIEEGSLLEFVKRSRSRKWAVLGARTNSFPDGFTAPANECRDEIVVDDTCVSVEYTTLDADSTGIPKNKRNESFLNG